MDLQIAIPSRSRASAQKTLNNLSENLWKYVSVWVPLEQLNEYTLALPPEIDVVPFVGSGIGVKRQAMLTSMSTGKLIMMDDDLRFYKRLEDGRFTVTSPADTEQMVVEILVLLDQYPHVGLVDKFMSQTKPRGHAECQRFNQVLGFNRDLFPKPWPMFRIPYAHEEHDMHLQFLTRGYKTAVSTEWSKTDIHDAKGGCSDWRSIEKFQQSHARMVELWPTIVTVKSPVDVKYNWRAARKIGGIV